MKKITVDISLCLSTVRKIDVPDDYDPENLEEYVLEQVDLPQNESGYEDWCVDNFCVI